MEMLRTAVSALSFSDPAEAAIDRESERRKAVALIAQLPTIVARHHRRAARRSTPSRRTRRSRTRRTSSRCCAARRRPSEETRAFDVAMILHAEHELNASTFTARVVAGTAPTCTRRSPPRSARSRGRSHGGANEAAMRVRSRRSARSTRVAGRRPRALRREADALRLRPSGLRDEDPRATDPEAALASSFSHDGGEPNWYAITEATERAVRRAEGALAERRPLLAARSTATSGSRTTSSRRSSRASRVAG